MNRRLVACWCLALVLACAGCTVNPVTGKSQLDLMGEAQEVEMGKAYYPSAVQSSLGPLDDRELQAAVARAGNAVAAVGHRPALPYEFIAVNDPQVNAFALPGGKICITRGLLSRMESEDGMAAVLGHEVGHVTARHAVAAYNREILATAVLVGGGIYMEAADVKNRELISLGAVIGAQLMMAHYSREQERQSDEFGLDYAIKAGYSPRGMVETQKVLLSLQQQRPGAIERMFASHPMSAERLATAEQTGCGAGAGGAGSPAQGRAVPPGDQPDRRRAAGVGSRRRRAGAARQARRTARRRRSSPRRYASSRRMACCARCTP